MPRQRTTAKSHGGEPRRRATAQRWNPECGAFARIGASDHVEGTPFRGCTPNTSCTYRPAGMAPTLQEVIEEQTPRLVELGSELRWRTHTYPYSHQSYGGQIGSVQRTSEFLPRTRSCEPMTAAERPIYVSSK